MFERLLFVYLCRLLNVCCFQLFVGRTLSSVGDCFIKNFTAIYCFFLLSPVCPEEMDWSKLYPESITGNASEKETPRVEFADIGCGYGGLLGNWDIDLETVVFSLLCINMMFVSLNIFTYSPIQWSYRHSSRINSSSVWRSGWKSQIMFKTVSSHCVPLIREATRTSPAFAAMQWSTSLTSFSKDRWVWICVFVAVWRKYFLIVVESRGKKCYVQIH